MSRGSDSARQNRRNRGILFCLGLSALVFTAGSSLRSQDGTLSVTSIETIPGSRVSLFMEAELAEPIRGFQIGIEYPERAMSLRGISFSETALQGQSLDVFNPLLTTGGFATLEAILDSRPPFDRTIPAGPDVRLARLDFEIKQGLEAGSEFTVSLASDLGFPPLAARIFRGDGFFSPAGLVPGTVRIADENVLKIRDTDSVQLGQLTTIEFVAFNLEPLQGFTIAVKFDPNEVRFLSGYIDDETITQAVGAESVTPVIDNEAGTFVLGVLLDIMPPFDGQVIPASGMAHTIAKADIIVSPEVVGEVELELELVDGLGTPPVKNIFTIDNQSVFPRKEGGTIGLVPNFLFLRGDAFEDGLVNITDPIRILNFAIFNIQGVPCEKATDANDDGMTDLADVIYILLFLFEGGPIIPPPFPDKGTDPTPDELTCESGLISEP